jgi:hypothetical protein
VKRPHISGESTSRSGVTVSNVVVRPLVPRVSSAVPKLQSAGSVTLGAIAHASWWTPCGRRTTWFHDRSARFGVVQGPSTYSPFEPADT